MHEKDSVVKRRMAMPGRSAALHNSTHITAMTAAPPMYFTLVAGETNLTKTRVGRTGKKCHDLGITSVSVMSSH